MLKNRLLNACDCISEFRQARRKVVDTVEGVIADLHTAVYTCTSTKHSTDKFHNILKRATPEFVNQDNRCTLKEISRLCNICQLESPRPQRFKLTLRDDKKFNHTVFIDVFYLDKKPIMLVVDESTRYQAVRWITSIISANVLKALRLCWIDVYLGPSDFITVDASKYFLLN